MNTPARRAYIALGVVVATFATVAFAATFPYFSPATGILKGNANTYVTTAATSADITATFSGTCNSTTFLRGDGSCAPETGTGTVTSVTQGTGITATPNPITGTGTIAIDTAVVPRLGNANVFSAAQTIGNNTPSWAWNELDAAVDEKRWRFIADGGVLQLQTRTDADASGTNIFTLDRTGTAVSALQFGNATDNPTYAFMGTGAISGNGSGLTSLNAGNVSSGILAVARGGTGIGTLTGIAKGNGTSAFTAAVASDVYGLWGGTCNSSSFLRGDGTCASPAAGVSPANPSATVGLTAKNGSASTYMRSDAAPALDQSITPTWTGRHTFTDTSGAALFSSVNPVIAFNETDAGADSKWWNVVAGGGLFSIQTRTDAGAAGGTPLSISRSGTTPTTIALAANNVTVNGSEVCRSDGTGCPAIPSFATGTVFANGSGCSVSNPVGMSSSCTRNGMGNYTIALTSGISGSKCTATLSGTITPSLVIFGFNNTFSNINVGAQQANGGGAVDPPQFHIICTR